MWEAKVVVAADVGKTNWKHKVYADWGDLMIENAWQKMDWVIIIESAHIFLF